MLRKNVLPSNFGVSAKEICFVLDCSPCQFAYFAKMIDILLRFVEKQPNKE